MPYTTDKLPEAVKKMPEHAQKIWLAAFNNALKQYGDEKQAFAVAWAACEKAGYMPEGSMAHLTMKASADLMHEGNYEVPKEIQIAPIGEYSDSEGRKFKITEESVQTIIKNKTRVNQLVVDYEHQTLSGKEAPAAGWIKELINKGKDGLWAVVEWTQKAKKYLRNREYRYLSPVLLANKKDVMGNYLPEFLHSASLTNTPQIDGMVPIVNRMASVPENINQEDEIMLKKIVELLALKSEATEAEVLEAVTVLKNKAATIEKETIALKSEINSAKSELQKVREFLGLKESSNLSEVTGTILALKQPGNAVSVQEFNELKKKLALRDRDDIVALAMKEGKISAAQKEWAEGYALADQEGFKVFVAKAPVVVPMGDLPKGGKADEKGGSASDKMTQLIKCKMDANKSMTYSEAFNEVQRENIALASEYAQELTV